MKHHAFTPIATTVLTVAVCSLCQPSQAQTSWTARTLPGAAIQHLEIGPGNELYTLQLTNPIQPTLSNDQGISWQAASGTGLPNGGIATDIRLGVTSNSTILVSAFTSAQGMWRSTDGGNTFTQLSALNGLPIGNYFLDGFCNASTGDIFAYGDVVLRSIDDGLTWTQTATEDFMEMASTTNALFAVSGNTIKRSDNNGVTWLTLTLGFPMNNIYGIATGYLDRVYAVGTDTKVIRSFDDGATWSPVNGGLSTAGFISRIAVSPVANEWACGRPNDIFRSSNASSWSIADNGLTLTVGNQLQQFRAAPDGSLYLRSNMGLWQADFATDISDQMTTTPHLTVVPNPAHDQIRVVDARGLRIQQAQVLDPSGRLVRTYDPGSLKDGMDISALDQGTYLVMFMEHGRVVALSRFVVH